MEKYIYIKDNKGNWNQWVVDDDTGMFTCRVSYSGDRNIITDIYRCKCYCEDNKLYSYEVRDTKYNTGKVALSSFGYIKLD